MLKIISLTALCALFAVACTQAPPVTDSQNRLWQQFAHVPLDKLLTAWGTPSAETTLTNHSRMVAYRRSTIFNFSSSTSCEVTFLATPPHFTIENIAMVGDPYECYMLSHGLRGEQHVNDMPPPGIYPYPYPYTYR